MDQAGKAASLEKAKADVELKAALVEVARKDRDAAAIQLGYTRLYAPFDGVIVARSTDPGKFVFGGASGSSEPLVTVARTRPGDGGREGAGQRRPVRFPETPRPWSSSPSSPG